MKLIIFISMHSVECDVHLLIYSFCTIEINRYGVLHTQKENRTVHFD